MTPGKTKDYERVIRNFVYNRTPLNLESDHDKLVDSVIEMNLTDSPHQNVVKVLEHMKMTLPSSEDILAAQKDAISVVETIEKKVRDISKYPIYYGLRVGGDIFKIVSQSFIDNGKKADWDRFENPLLLKKDQGWHITLLFRNTEVRKEVLKLYDRGFLKKDNAFKFEQEYEVAPLVILWNCDILTMIVKLPKSSFPLGIRYVLILRFGHKITAYHSFDYV